MILYSRDDNYTHKIFKILGFKVKIKKKNINYKANINGDNYISLNEKFYGQLIVSGNNNTISSGCHVRNGYIKIAGEDNIIEFPSDCGSLIDKISICINGSNNHIIIKSPNCFIGRLNIAVGYFINPNNKWHIYMKEKVSNNTKMILGGNSTLNSGEILLPENGTNLTIGDECMLSNNLNLYASDFHAIVDNNCVLNRGNNIVIGDHCWIGKNVFICKNTKIPSNSIVGACSVVTKRFDEENIIIAGNPAKIVKRNINWDRSSPDEYENSKNGMAVERERERVIPLKIRRLRKVA